MNRQQKEQVVETLRKGFAQSDASFLVNYSGLSVAQLQTLRKDLRNSGGAMHVAKARLMKLAAEGVDGAQEMSPLFKNQVALVFSEKEPVAVAKVLHTFAKNSEKLSLLGGVFERQMLNAADVVSIASLPSREVLLSRLLGALQAPTRGLVTALNMQIMKLLWTLKKIEEKK